MNNVDIRPATADDLEAVRVLLRETWHDTYDAIYGAQEVEHLTAQWHSIEAMEQRLERPQAAFLVAQADGSIAGIAFAEVEERSSLWLRQLYVEPSRQREGIGHRLLDAALKQFGAVGRILVEVEAANRKAFAFYEKQGFETLGIRRDDAGGSITVIRMERLLPNRPAG